MISIHIHTFCNTKRIVCATGSAAFERAERSVWRLTASDPEVAGYVQQGGNLTYAVIRGAGHIAPYDQPERTNDMISRWIAGRPFPNLPNPSPLQ